MFIRELFKEPRSITAEALSSTTAGTPTIHTGLAGAAVMVQCTTGLCWVTPLTTAPSSGTAWRLQADDPPLEFRVPAAGFVAVLGDSTAAKHQLMVLED